MAFDDLPYRTPGVSPGFGQATAPVSQDEANYDSLKGAYLEMKAAIDGLDKWHAFDLDEKTSEMAVKQQILAHRKAFEIVAPAFQTLESAVELVDREFIARQKGNK